MDSSSSSSAEAAVLTAYLKPLVAKHSANELITYEDLTQAHTSAIAALNRQSAQSSIRETLRALHQQQVEAYKKAAVEQIQTWAEEATLGDTLPVWRMVPQSIVEAAKQRVQERCAVVSAPEPVKEVEPVKEAEPVKEMETEENEEGEMEAEDGEEVEEGEQVEDAAAAMETTSDTVPANDSDVKAPTKSGDKPVASAKEPAKGTGKPIGGILAKKLAAARAETEGGDEKSGDKPVASAKEPAKGTGTPIGGILAKKLAAARAETEGGDEKDKAPPKAGDKPTASAKEPAKGTGKPKGGILAKKQAARGKGVNKKVQQAKSPPPQAKRGRPVRKTRAAAAGK